MRTCGNGDGIPPHLGPTVPSARSLLFPRTGILWRFVPKRRKTTLRKEWSLKPEKSQYDDLTAKPLSKVWVVGFLVLCVCWGGALTFKNIKNEAVLQWEWFLSHYSSLSWMGFFYMVKKWVKIKRIAIFAGMYTPLDEISSKHKIAIVGLNASSSWQHSFMWTPTNMIGTLCWSTWTKKAGVLLWSFLSSSFSIPIFM